jgi:hypothetical protein
LPPSTDSSAQRKLQKLSGNAGLISRMRMVRESLPQRVARAGPGN